HRGAQPAARGPIRSAGLRLPAARRAAHEHPDRRAGRSDRHRHGPDHHPGVLDVQVPRQELFCEAPRHPAERAAVSDRRGGAAMSQLVGAIISFAFYQTVIRTTTPLLLATLGGLIADLSGAPNVALEGQMLIGCLTAVI